MGGGGENFHTLLYEGYTMTKFDIIFSFKAL